jgi:hypothetical protein
LGAAAGDGPSITVNLPQTPVEGNVLIAIVGADNGATLTLDGWTTAIANTGNAAEAIFYRVVGPNEPSSISATRTGGGDIGLQVFEYSGLATTDTLDQTGSGTTGQSINRSSGAFTCGPVTTTQANELLVAGFTHNAAAGTNVNDAWTGSFAERVDLLDASNSILVASASLVVTSTGTYDTGSNLQDGGGSGASRCQLATFRAAP